MPRDYELSVQHVYQAALRPGDIAIDIGAHIGRHTLPMAEVVGPTGKVHAIEPLPDCRQALENALNYHRRELLPQVQTLDCAMGNTDGEAEFIVAEDLPWLSGLRQRPYDMPTDLSKIQVQVRTVDSLFLDLPALRYIKVDAEGGEYHIFQGAAACLEKFRPLVTFEFGIDTLEHYNVTPRDMGEFWAARDYKLYDIDGYLQPTPADFVRRVEQLALWDYVAVPTENAELDQLVQEALKKPAFL